MSAAALIREAQDAGVILRMSDGKLKAAGKLSVVQSWAPRLREHKTELIEALAANNPDFEPSQSPGDWRELASAYHAHHFGCPVCIAAGRGTAYGMRCGAGMALWTDYQSD